MASPSCTRAQLVSARIAATLVVAFVILVSQTAAESKSGHPGNLPLNKSSPFFSAMARFRRDVKTTISTVEGGFMKHTPGVGIHKIHTIEKTWPQAEKVCQDEGSLLAVVNSPAEAEAIEELMVVAKPHIVGGKHDQVFIGFNDIDEEGKYVTVDGKTLEEAGFTVWLSGNPSTYDPPEGIEEDCGSMYKNGQLNDVSCSSLYAFVCEFPISDSGSAQEPEGDEREPAGPAGSDGEPGPSESSRPPGKPGLSPIDACLAVLSTLEQNRAGPLVDGGKAPSFSGDTELHEKCKEFVAKAYELMGVPSPSQVPLQPDGTMKSPAKTCKHLFLAYPDKPSGKYWIDPNGDDIGDAIFVRCDAEKRATCVTPESPRTSNVSYTGHKRAVWLSEIDDELQITYTAGAEQVSALQLLSRHAEQNVTYHCMKSVAYFDTEYQNTERGLRLLAWNDFELQPNGNRLFRYDILSDECKDRLDEWKETVITYRTNQPARLPVLDVGLRDVGKPDQQFSVEIGEVCFR